MSYTVTRRDDLAYTSAGHIWPIPVQDTFGQYHDAFGLYQCRTHSANTRMHLAYTSAGHIWPIPGIIICTGVTRHATCKQIYCNFEMMCHVVWCLLWWHATIYREWEKHPRVEGELGALKTKAECLYEHQWLSFIIHIIFDIVCPWCYPFTGTLIGFEVESSHE